MRRIGTGWVLAVCVLAYNGCSTPIESLRPASVDGTAIGPVLEDARAIALDPQGNLYVTDAGASTVIVLDGNGSYRSALGGPGTGDYAFLGPSGIDPTNGLVLIVADTGNGRIQRFSRDGRLLDTVPVPTARGEGDAQRSFGVRDTAGDDRRLGQGRPTAVASAVTGELFAIEETDGAVLRWDDRRRFDRVVGGMEAGEGALRIPVDLALGPDGKLFVADRGRAAVLVYDSFGQYLRRIGDGQLTDVVAVTIVAGQLAVVLPRAVRYYEIGGEFDRSFEMPEGEPLVDIAGFGGATFYLTRNRVYRRDSGGRQP